MRTRDFQFAFRSATRELRPAHGRDASRAIDADCRIRVCETGRAPSGPVADTGPGRARHLNRNTPPPMTASDQTSGTTSPGNWLANQPYLLLCITTMCWAGNAIVGRFAAGHIPPVTLSFLRWSLAFLIVLPFAWKHLVQDWTAIRSRLGLMIAALDHRHRRLQHPAILGAGTYPGAEHAAAAVGRTAGGRDLVAAPARGTADAGAGLRHVAVADRRAGDPAAWRPHHAHQHRIQQGRRHLHRGAGDLRAVFGADAEAAADPRACRSSASPSAAAPPA